MPQRLFVAAPDDTGLKISTSPSALREPGVEVCHPELIREARQRTAFAAWHLKRTSVNGQNVDQHARSKRHGPERWDGAIIAIIDDGVDLDHQEFVRPQDRRAPRRDAPDNDPRPYGNNHGTACAGVAALTHLRRSGVAPRARLIPIRLASNLGRSRRRCFRLGGAKRADVISCSWGRWTRFHRPNDRSITGRALPAVPPGVDSRSERAHGKAALSASPPATETRAWTTTAMPALTR